MRGDEPLADHLRTGRIVRGEVAPVAEDGVELGMVAQEGARPCEPVRQGDVVGVVEGDPVARGVGEPEVAGSAEAAMVAPDDGEPARVARKDIRRLVGRAVVDDDHLEVPIGLGEHAVEALGEPAGGIERRDDDGDGGHRRCSSGRPGSERGTDRGPERFGVMRSEQLGNDFEELPLLAPDVGFQQIGERRERRCERRLVVAGCRHPVAQRLQAAMLVDQPVEEGGARFIAGHAFPQHREQHVLLGAEVTHQMLAEEGQRVGRAALRRARRGHGGDGARRRRVVEPEGHHERVAVLVGERNQALVPAPSRHWPMVLSRSGRGVECGAGRVRHTDGLITLAAAGIPPDHGRRDVPRT